MPRRSSGPKLWFDRARETWVIVDRKHKQRTGFAASQSREAQEALAAYIGEKHVVTPETEDPAIADVLNVYLLEKVPQQNASKNTEYNIGSLAKWWGDKTVHDINTTNCRLFAQSKKGARRDLEVLRAAVNYWHIEKKPLTRKPTVVLPEKYESRDRVIDRKQFARFLRASLKARHEHKGKIVHHLARFLILLWYSGSRSGALLGLRWSMVDFESGIVTRRARGERQTKKRKPPFKAHARLLTHLRRWKRLDDAPSGFVVHWQGEKVTKLRRSFATARRAAKLPQDVTAHSLRHSRATLLAKRKVPPDEAAQSLGMSLETYMRVYVHHDPEWQENAASVA